MNSNVGEMILSKGKEEKYDEKFGRKALALSLTAVLGASMVLTGCGKSKSEDKKGEDTTAKIGLTTGLASDTTADISIMTWSGDSKYYEDIGSMDLFN